MTHNWPYDLMCSTAPPGDVLAHYKCPKMYLVTPIFNAGSLSPAVERKLFELVLINLTFVLYRYIFRRLHYIDI